MRPVTIPDALIADYSEAVQLAVPTVVNVRNAGITNKTKDQIADLMMYQLEEWIRRGAPISEGSPDFKSDDIEVAHRDYLKKLAAGGGWKNARRTLIGAIGAYCSYCGSAVYSHLHIEHKLPKSTFPKKAFHYRNFLLACASCNSCKRDKPNQRIFVSPPPPPLQTNAAERVILNGQGLRYYWPDFTWTPGPAIAFPFTVTLRKIADFRNTLNFAGEMTPRESNELLDAYKQGQVGQDRGLLCRYHGPANRYKNYFGLKIEATPGLNAEETGAAQEIIDLVSLNRIVKASEASKTIDRRIETRTKAYFTARIVRQQLDQAVLVGNDYFALILNQAKTTISNTGHWLVWLRVFGNAVYPTVPPVPPPLAQTTSFQETLRRCFPGTSFKSWVP